MSDTKQILITITSLALFFGGIIMLFFYPVRFWSYFFGIPATQIGIVFLIFTFEKLTRNTIDEDEITEQQKEYDEIHKKKTPKN